MLLFCYQMETQDCKKYNLLFRGYVGKQLKIAYKHKIKFYISPFYSMKKVNSIISQTRRVLESFRDEREINREQMGDFYFVISGLSYDCLNRVNELLNMCSMVECKNMIIVGSAGNIIFLGSTDIHHIHVTNSPLVLLNTRINHLELQSDLRLLLLSISNPQVGNIPYRKIEQYVSIFENLEQALISNDPLSYLAVQGNFFFCFPNCSTLSQPRYKVKTD